MNKDMTDYPVMSAEELAGRKKRNMFIALGIVVFMGLVFTITLVRIRENVARGQDWQAETASGQRGGVAESGTGTVLSNESEGPNE